MAASCRATLRLKRKGRYRSTPGVSLLERKARSRTLRWESQRVTSSRYDDGMSDADPNLDGPPWEEDEPADTVERDENTDDMFGAPATAATASPIEAGSVAAILPAAAGNDRGCHCL